MASDAEKFLKAFQRRVAKRITIAVKEATEAVAERARDSHSYRSRTGFLEREGVDTRIEDGGYAGVIFLDDEAVPYALPVHQGSRPHVIKPRKKKALRWADAAGKEFIFARSVNHPGYEGDPFIFRAFDDMQPEIQDIFDSQMEIAIKEAENAFNA